MLRKMACLSINIFRDETRISFFKWRISNHKNFQVLSYIFPDLQKRIEPKRQFIIPMVDGIKKPETADRAARA